MTISHMEITITPTLYWDEFDAQQEVVMVYFLGNPSGYGPSAIGFDINDKLKRLVEKMCEHFIVYGPWTREGEPINLNDEIKSHKTLMVEVKVQRMFSWPPPPDFAPPDLEEVD